MQRILTRKESTPVQGRQDLRFESSSAFHLIRITARARDKKQIASNALAHEELTVSVDGKEYGRASTFSGGKLHNRAQTIYLLTFLRGVQHTIALAPNEKQPTVMLETVEVFILKQSKDFVFPVENQAEDGDRRPWITILLVDLPLLSLSATVTYVRRRWDSDDVKVIIDGKTQTNLQRTIKYLLWRFAGSLLPKTSPTRTETEKFNVNLPKRIHIVEFMADRMPTMHTATIDLGATPETPFRIPSVNDPAWTGDFADDSVEMLLARMIFGEAENQPKEAKSGVGFTVINRVANQRTNWGVTVREVLLKEHQYDALWNPDRRDAVRDPLRGANEAEKFPPWATRENFKIKIGDILFYELER